MTDLSFSEQQHGLEHVEDFAGRLVDGGDQSPLLLHSEALQSRHHLEGQSRVQTGSGFLHDKSEAQT